MRRRFSPFLVVAAVLSVVLATPVTRAQESALLSALQDELTRSMNGLRLKDEPPPYYIEYQADDVTTLRLAAHLGALETNDPSTRLRTLRVEVRVGDYQFDSSRFVTQRGRDGGFPAAEGTAVAPLDDNYDAVRRQLWLMTDAAYKRAVNVFARKKAAFQNRAGTEPLPDLSRETPLQLVLTAPSTAQPAGDWVERMRQVSGVFQASSHLQSTGVSLTAQHGMRYYVNSEGFKIVTPVESASLLIVGEAQADDGMMLRDVYRATERSLADLPSASDLTARAREMSARLEAERKAPVGEEYTGPVLFEGQAGPELLAQTFVPLLLAERPPDSDNPRAAQTQGQVTPFLSRIGLRVFAESFSVADTPSLQQFAGRPVAGAYGVDDEGVRARDVSLIESGRLVTLLIGRTPQRNLPLSNGHVRGSGVQAGVVEVRSARAIPAADLRKKYLELLRIQDKPFGYVIRGIDTQTFLHIVKVMPDGREETVRGLRVGNVPPSAFRDVLEASEERTMFSYRSGGSTVSVIAPALLFEEIEIQKARDILQKPPIVPSPLQ
jgi:hypothetical protein